MPMSKLLVSKLLVLVDSQSVYLEYVAVLYFHM